MDYLNRIMESKMYSPSRALLGGLVINGDASIQNNDLARDYSLSPVLSPVKPAPTLNFKSPKESAMTLVAIDMRALCNSFKEGNVSLQAFKDKIGNIDPAEENFSEVQFALAEIAVEWENAGAILNQTIDSLRCKSDAFNYRSDVETHLSGVQPEASVSAAQPTAVLSPKIKRSTTAGGENTRDETPY